MRGSNGFTAGSNHLVQRTASGELGIEIPAKFTNAAGSCVETMDDGSCDMFHEKRLLGEATTESPDWEAGSKSASVDLHH
jgi:hypothetical protein